MRCHRVNPVERGDFSLPAPPPPNSNSKGGGEGSSNLPLAFLTSAEINDCASRRSRAPIVSLDEEYRSNIYGMA